MFVCFFFRFLKILIDGFRQNNLQGFSFTVQKLYKQNLFYNFLDFHYLPKLYTGFKKFAVFDSSHLLLNFQYGTSLLLDFYRLMKFLIIFYAEVFFFVNLMLFEIHFNLINLLCLV